jgi:hypothetical protein
VPVGDWQFWVVTLLAAACLLFVVRAVAPRPGKKRGKRVSLTVEREDPGQ